MWMDMYGALPLQLVPNILLLCGIIDKVWDYLASFMYRLDSQFIILIKLLLGHIGQSWWYNYTITHQAQDG